MNRIGAVLRDAPEIQVAPVFQVCERIMAATAYRDQKQVYFLYQSVAAALQAIVRRSTRGPDTDRRHALQQLWGGMDQPHDALRRATAEALGTLPLTIDRCPAPPEPDLKTRFPETLPLVDSAWLAGHNIRCLNGWEWQGRSMRVKTRSGDVLVVKCLREGEAPSSLWRESAWMDYLRALPKPFERCFQIPRPLAHAQGYLVRAPRESRRPPAGTVLHPKRYAIAFRTSPDYFRYPNEARPDRRLGANHVCEVLSRNAWLMGWLLARGMAHTAPIPLFHNRAQRHRREDGGRYRWTHAGRLDCWLTSCRYPNFGVSGLRDFEHFTFVRGRPQHRYEIIGSHLISLLLVAGSYFRNKAPDRVGLDTNGRPVDARDLFDRGLFQTMIGAIIQAYHEGFAGETLPAGEGVLPASVLDRLIEEMGVDRHMEEMLRVADQDAMDQASFVSFLQSRGVALKEAKRIPKGAGDIALITGPHLGGFNQSISLPELIDFAARGAARCVAGRFRREHALVP